MQKLLLLRHAKSDRSKSASGRGDHARPLNERGRMAASLMGRHMREKNYLPALVLCSTAERTRETLKILLGFFKTAPEIRYQDSLYLAPWPNLLAAVRAAPQMASPLLLVGHNPGMEQLALALAAPPKSAAGHALAETMAEKFPTAALAVLNFRNASWGSIRPGTGRLADFVRPKDLASGKNENGD